MPDKIITDDKYKDKTIRFYNKDDHYELIFTDYFDVPGTYENKANTNIVDIVTDLRSADKTKELHIFVGSYGGYVHCLNMLIQHILQFEYRVGINLGMADSCGFMLLCYCNEIYTSPWCEFMYHEMSGLNWGKVSEQRNLVEYNEKWWNILVENSFASQILTKEELTLGKTSEVYLTGDELLRRGVVMDYESYKNRCIPTKTDNEFYIVKGEVYRKIGTVYKKYTEEKPCKKNNQNTHTWQDLVLACNQ